MPVRVAAAGWAASNFPRAPVRRDAPTRWRPRRGDQPADHRGGHHVITDDLNPTPERQIQDDQQRPALVPGGDHLEKQVRGRTGRWDVQTSSMVNSRSLRSRLISVASRPSSWAAPNVPTTQRCRTAPGTRRERPCTPARLPGGSCRPRRAEQHQVVRPAHPGGASQVDQHLLRSPAGDHRCGPPKPSPSGSGPRPRGWRSRWLHGQRLSGPGPRPDTPRGSSSAHGPGRPARPR